MSSWWAVIVFAVLASCAAVVVTGYFRGNRKAQEAASARSAAVPAGPAPAAADPPERGENPGPPTESWLWG